MCQGRTEEEREKTVTVDSKENEVGDGWKVVSGKKKADSKWSKTTGKKATLTNTDPTSASWKTSATAKEQSEVKRTLLLDHPDDTPVYDVHNNSIAPDSNSTVASGNTSTGSRCSQNRRETVIQARAEATAAKNETRRAEADLAVKERECATLTEQNESLRDTLQNAILLLESQGVPADSPALVNLREKLANLQPQAQQDGDDGRTRAVTFAGVVSPEKTGDDERRSSNDCDEDMDASCGEEKEQHPEAMEDEPPQEEEGNSGNEEDMEVSSREEEERGSKQEDADEVCDEASVESVTKKVKTSRSIRKTRTTDTKTLVEAVSHAMEAVYDEVGTGIQSIKFVSKGAGLAQSSQTRAARPSSLQERVRSGVATSGTASDSDDDDAGEEPDVGKAKTKQTRRKEKKKDKKKHAKEEKKPSKKHKKKDKERRRSKGGDGDRRAA